MAARCDSWSCSFALAYSTTLIQGYYKIGGVWTAYAGQPSSFYPYYPLSIVGDMVWTSGSSTFVQSNYT
jgi:hypothetical protein